MKSVAEAFAIPSFGVNFHTHLLAWEIFALIKGNPHKYLSTHCTALHDSCIFP